MTLVADRAPARPPVADAGHHRSWLEVAVVVSGFLAPGLAFVTSPILARVLGPQARGEFAIYQAALALVTTLGALGVEEVLLAEVSARRSVPAALVRRARRVVLAGSLIAVIPLLLVGKGLGPLGIAAALTSIVVVTAAVPRALTLGMGVIGPVSVGRIAYIVVRTGAILAAVAAGVLTPGLAALIYTLSMAVGVVPMYARARTLSAVADPDDGPPADERLNLMRACLPVLVMQGATRSLLRLDQLVLGATGMVRELGYYAAAASLAEGLLLINTAVRPVLIARWTRSRHFGAATRLLGLALLAEAGALAVAWVVAPRGLGILLGPAYAGAVGCFRILLLGNLFFSVQGYLGAGLLTLGHRVQPAAAACVGAGVNAAIIWPACRHGGGVGAAWASVATYATCAVVMVVLGRRTMCEGPPTVAPLDPGARPAAA